MNRNAFDAFRQMAGISLIANFTILYVMLPHIMDIILCPSTTVTTHHLPNTTQLCLSLSSILSHFYLHHCMVFDRMSIIFIYYL